MKLRTSDNQKTLDLIKSNIKHVDSAEIADDRLIISVPIEEMADILSLINKNGITIREVVIAG